MKVILALALAATASADDIFALTAGGKHWDECEASCLAQGQEFACIDSAEENLAATALMAGNSYMWFGANDMQAESHWVCNGQAMPYTNWYSGEPNDYYPLGGEDVGAIYSSGNWNDLPGGLTSDGGNGRHSNNYVAPCLCRIPPPVVALSLPSDDNGGLLPSFSPNDNTGAICFAGDSLLTLEDGSTKNFHQLEVGDSILGADRNGVTSYSPVLFLPHPLNNNTRQFDEIELVNDMVVRMTRNHLIPLCDGSLVTARSLKAGDCVNTASGKENVAKVIKNVEAGGIYTAVTTTEFLVVDGIVASPFALAHGIAHSLFDRADVGEWCKDNSHLVLATADKEIKEMRRTRLTEGTGSEACVSLMATLFENYQDEGVGWGTNGWGYRNFKTTAGDSLPLAARLSGFHETPKP